MNVGVVGGSGYTGGELIRLLLLHPMVNLSFVSSRRFKGKSIGSVHPNLRQHTKIRFKEYNPSRIGDECELVFLSVPHGTSQKYVPELYSMGLKIIDLSADFRLKKLEEYEKYYESHSCPEYLEKSVYGLPEIHREEIRNSRLIACPGCISTSAILALAPFINSDFISKDFIVIDAKMGSTGAGRTASQSTHHAEREGVIRPYKVTGHRHLAEIEQELSMLAKENVKLAFSAHAVDVVRGILCTIHVPLKREVNEKEIGRKLREFYKDEYFIRVIAQKKGLYRLPDPKTLIGSNFCDIGFELDSHMPRLVVLSALDNLMKGAAGQAIQNMNIAMGWREETGLTYPPLFPA